MKIKKILLIIVLVLFIFGCKKKEEQIIPKASETEESQIEKNITSQDIGTIVGEYSNRFTLIKVNNNNQKDIYVNVTLHYYNNGEEQDSDEVYLYVAAGKSAYAVSKMFAEDPVFTSYKYEIVYISEVKEYSNLINNIKASYSNTGNDILINMTNLSSMTTTPSAIILFYKDGKIVSVSECKMYNLMPKGTQNEKISYPHKDLNNLIPFDNVNVFLNEVSIN